MGTTTEPSRDADASTSETGAFRVVGAWPATAIVIANMLGTGIFVTSGLLARDLGDARLAIAAWTVGGLLALAGANAYAELGAMFPRAGGEYVYLSRAFHPALGFVSGCISLVVGFAASIAASAVACAHYVHDLAPAIPIRAGAVALILIPTFLHSLGISFGARAQGLITALEVLLVLGFALAGFVVGNGDPAHFAAHPVDASVVGRFALALVLVSFAYSGFGAAGYVAGDLRDPTRTLPRALLAGTALVTAIYVVLNLAFFFGAPAQTLGARPEIVAHVAAHGLFGEGMARATSTGIAITLFASIGAMVMAGPRVPLAMAEDGLFFPVFAKRGRGGSPAFGLGVQAALAIGLVLGSTYEGLLTYVGFLLALSAAITVLAAIVLRLREPHRDRPYRAPFLFSSGTAFVALSFAVVGVAIVERPETGLAGLLTVLLCAGLYLAFARARAPEPRP